MAAATKTPKQGERTRRKMFMPYDRADEPIVQPLPELAGLDDDQAFEVLTNPARFAEFFGRAPQRWYYARAYREIGRSEGRFKAWMSNHYAVRVHRTDPATIKDRIAPEPDGYERRSPYWLETTFRAWAIAEGLMTRRGVAVPYKPSGRPPGRLDSVPRQRTATMKAGAVEVLRACEELTAAGATPAEARQQLAARYRISERKVSRRLTAGRQMHAAGIHAITPDLTPAEVAHVVTATYRLLMADGRRKNTDNARADVAERLGLDRDTVDRALDAAAPPAAEPAVEAPVEERPRNYEAEELRAQMESAILVDNITRGTAPLHPES